MRAWIGAAAALALAACAEPPSAVRTASAAAYAAADKFVALAAASPSAPPRATDASAGPLLDAVFNTAPVQSVTPAWSDIDAVNDWLSSALRVGEVYMLAGAGITDVSQAANNPTAEARIGQNTQTYAPEMGRFLDAELAIEGAEAASTSAYLAANPDAIQNADTAKGLDTTRGGFAQTAGGVIQTLADPATGNDWRQARARALIAFAGRAAPLLTDAQKQQLAQDATQAAAQAGDPQLGALLNQFAGVITAKGG